MITRYMSLALLCFFISVNLTSSAEFYLLKVLKAPVTSARNANEKLYLKILPLAKSHKKVYQKVKTDKEKSGFPCRPGQICIGKVQHNQNSVVINNGLREPSFLPPHNFFPYIHLDDTTDTDEYIEVNDDSTPFSDLTRYENVNKQKRDIKRKDAKESVSTDYLDINDLLRSKNKNVSQNHRKADAVMIESQGKRYMRVDSSDYSESSEETDEKETTEDIHEEEATEVKHKKRTPKRFEVVNNHNKKQTYDSSSETNSESDDLENFKPITTQRPKKRRPMGQKKKKKNVDNFEDVVTVKDEVYIQRPGNYVKLGSSSEEYYRRRLQHFLPKRYHWNEEDISKLGYYWFNGPQGNYPGSWRISY